MKSLLLTVLFLIGGYAQNIIEPLSQKVKYDEDRVNLGKELFFENMLSRNQDISCASCHSVYGADNKRVSLGTKGREGFINSPTIFNLNYHIGFFWNGRSESLEEQIIEGPIVNRHEMDNDEKTIMKRLSASKKYIDLFSKAYNEKPSYNKMLQAIAEFERTLITPDSKFDQYLRGERELSKKEKRGFELFQTYGCISCHNGINVGSNSYQKFGSVISPFAKEESRWKDRFEVTKNKTDINVFKVPSLRNVEKTAPYFHDGSARTLKDAINQMAYFNVGIVLSEDEIESIESFLITLTGKIPETFGLKR